MAQGWMNTGVFVSALISVVMADCTVDNIQTQENFNINKVRGQYNYKY